MSRAIVDVTNNQGGVQCFGLIFGIVGFAMLFKKLVGLPKFFVIALDPISRDPVSLENATGPFEETSDGSFALEARFIFLWSQESKIKDDNL